MSLGLGQLAGLAPDDLAQLLQRIQAYGQPQQDPGVSGPQAGTQGRPPQITGTEADAQRLEQQQASPQDLAALGGSPTDRLLFDRSGFGGGPNGFTGSADPYAARTVPLPPSRPSDDALVAQPATTGTVSGMNPDATGGPQRRLVASSSYHPDLASNMPPGGRPAAAADFRGQPGDFDPLTGTVIGGSPRPLGSPQAPTAPVAGGAPVPGQTGAQPSLMERFAGGLDNPDVSSFLRNLSIGLLTHRGIGPGIGAGLAGYQQSSMGDVKQQLELLKYRQQLQGQQAQRNYLISTRGLSPDAADALIANPTLLSNQLALDKPNYQTIGGNVYDLNKNGGVPGAGNLIGSAGVPLEQEVKKADALATVADAHKDDTIRYITDPNTKQQYPFNESAYLRAQAGTGRGVSGSGVGGAGTTPQPGTGSDAPPLGPPITGKGPTPAEEAEQRIIGDARGKILSSAIEAGDPARKRIAVTDQMAAALNQAAPNMTTGPLSGSVMTAKEALAGVLGRPIEGLSGQEMLNSMGPILAGEAAKGITSRPALAEFKAIANVKPGQQFSVEGNRALLDVIRQNAQREADLSDLASSAKDAGDFAQKREGYLRDNPLINPFTQKPFGSASGSGPGMSLGANAGGGQSAGSPGDPCARFQQLVGSGMSKADAYAQMHREGM